ncbi:MAG: ABC transporter substrate-binding protein, partial [Candidatus Kariarchaeaceae archaeon]
MIHLLVFSFACSAQSTGDEDEITEPLFEITLLGATTSGPPLPGILVAEILADELPKIGIEVNLVKLGVGDVYLSSFAHKRDNKSAHIDGNGNIIGAIPVYEEGGYDVVIWGHHETLDYNPALYYSNAQFSPSSYNFASYDNDEISTLISEYASELDPVERANMAPNIQRIAYDDQPYINIYNTAKLWAYDPSWTSLTPADLLFLETKNIKDGWKDIQHDTRTDIVISHSNDLDTFSPFNSRHFEIEAQYLNPIFPGLYERDIADPYYSFIPVIANALPTWNTENTIATIDINPAAKFSTGKSVTTEDVVNSFHMFMSPAWSVGRYYSILTDHIVTNDSIQIIDSDTIQITLKKPYFLANQLFSVPIFDADEVGTSDAPLGDEDNGYDFNTEAWKFHGAAPFMYDENSPDHGIDTVYDNVKLVANLNYWRGTPKLDSLHFIKYDSRAEILTALENDEVHIDNSYYWLEPSDVEG